MITQEQIKEWNDEFRQASPSEKRVLIAQDVIAQLLKKTYRAKFGDYIKLDDTARYDDDVQKNFDSVSCNTCALGALFMSHVKFCNNIKFGDIRNITYVTPQLRTLEQYFPKEQLSLIETAFEGSSYLYLCEETKEAEEFHKKYKNDEERLIAIMENIIDNKGTFVL